MKEALEGKEEDLKSALEPLAKSGNLIEPNVFLEELY